MHQAVMLLQIEVHPVDNGRCTGQIVPKSELEQYGLTNKQVIVVSADNKADLLIKLKKKIEEFKS